ncbi:MAG: hypothetical protein H6Q67_1533 [Firmicutes bacterium]|nr:hypothetical protein [Bacillota bacterium]
MNLKQLYYFVSVAECLNFTKAAQKLFVAQTIVSHQIIALEKELGITLFQRNTRKVQLTNAGKMFYDDIKLVLPKFEQAVQNTTLANSSPCSLTIGFHGLSEKKFLSPWIRTFLSEYPNINLKLFTNTIENLQESIAEGHLDILFRLSDGFDINPKLAWENICKVANPLCAVMHHDHPLSKNLEVHQNDLSNQPFVFFDQKSNPLGFSLIIEDCNHTGFCPNVITTASSAEALLLLVESQIGITILPRCFEIFAGDNVKFIELADENKNIPFLTAAWKPNNNNPNILSFINMVKSQEHSITNSVVSL